MRVVLADLKGVGGLVAKDTVAGGYGSRLVPFSKVSHAVHLFKRRYINVPSVQMAYLAAICAEAGHDVSFTRQALVDGDVAIVLSSLVDHRNETSWADQMRARGVRVGFVGLTASKLPHLFASHADFVIKGEPEAAVQRLAAGEMLSGMCDSPAVDDLDSLPFPRWDLLGVKPRTRRILTPRPSGGGYTLLSSRSCPEFCTYCPHRILTRYRARSVDNVVAELEDLCRRDWRPYVIFRDPLFTERRDRVVELCEAIMRRGLHLRFDCETRLDRLDNGLLDLMYEAGLRAISYGVESVSPDTLRKVARRPIPEAHHREVIAHCRELGVATAAFYVFGFLTDTWESIAATIDFAIEMDSTIAQFKLLTPYPGTPLWKQLEPRVYETDWEKFDGYTPTFTHPSLTAQELRFLLGAAYTRFYVRPSYLANILRISDTRIRSWFGRFDRRALAMCGRLEAAKMSRSVTC